MPDLAMPDLDPGVLAAFARIKAGAPSSDLLLAYLPVSAVDGDTPAWVTNLEKRAAYALVGRRLAQLLAETRAERSGQPAPAYVVGSARFDLIKNIYYPAQAKLTPPWLLLLLLQPTGAAAGAQVAWMANSRWLMTGGALQLLGSAIYRVPTASWVIS